MHTNWEKDFFKDVALEMWNRAMTPEATRTEAEFLFKTLALKPGDHVLDVPCGGGRLALELARRGCRATGIDLSEEYVAQANAAAGDLQANFKPGDMKALNVDATFDAAFCCGNSFGYLDAEAAPLFLRSVASALKPSSRFLIDSGMTAESILPTRVPQRWFRLGDLYMLSQNTYDVRHSCMDIEYTFIQNGRTDTRVSTSFVFTVAEICRMFEAAGFRIVELLSSTNGEPYQFGSPRLILVSERI